MCAQQKDVCVRVGLGRRGGRVGERLARRVELDVTTRVVVPVGRAVVVIVKALLEQHLLRIAGINPISVYAKDFVLRRTGDVVHPQGVDVGGIRVLRSLEVHRTTYIDTG